MQSMPGRNPASSSFTESPLVARSAVRRRWEIDGLAGAASLGSGSGTLGAPAIRRSCGVGATETVRALILRVSSPSYCMGSGPFSSIFSRQPISFRDTKSQFLPQAARGK
jgi:hypothetical protein